MKIIQKVCCGAAAAALVLSAVVPAVAQEPKDERKVDVFEFPEELVKGSTGVPGGDAIVGELRGKTSSLIKVRKHFVPELIKSADDL